MPRIGQILEVVVDADTKPAETKLNKLGDDAGSGGGWGAKLAKGALGAFAAVGTAAAGLVGYGVKIAADNEQAQISFTTMLGSAQKAQSFIKELQNFAAKTPFDFPGIQKAATSLISAGFEANKVIPIMTTLGNVTSGMGTGAEGVQRATVALQQMSAAGKISGEDLNQLRDAGIPVFDLLAGATGKTKEQIAAMAQAGKLGKDEMNAMFDALANGGAGLEKFDGLMAKQSESLTGLISTLKDTVGQSLATMATPIVAGLKDALPQVNDTLNQIFKTVGPQMSGAIGSLLGTLSALLPAIAPIVGVIGGALSSALDSLVPIIKKSAPDMQKLAQAFGKLLTAVLPVLPQLLSLAVKVLPPLTTLMTVLANVITKIPVPVLTALVVAFVAFTQVIAPIMALVSAVSAAGGVIAFLAAQFPVLAAVLGVISAPVIAVVAAVAALAAIAYLVVRNWSTIASFFSGLWGGIQAVFSAAIGWIGDHMGTLARVVLFALTGGFSEIALFFVRHWSDIKDGAAGMVSGVVDWFKKLPGRAVAALGDISGALVDAGGKLIEGFIHGITGMFGKVKDKLGELTGKLTSWKGPPSRDRTLLHGSGRMVIDGFIAGLESRYGAVSKSLGGLTDSLNVGASSTYTVGAQASGVGGGAQAGARAVAAAAGVTIINQVQGTVISERQLMEATRDSLIRTGYANAGGVIGGQG